MRIVVTGGSGKAGRWTVDHLRQAGHDVLNVDRRHYGSAHGLCLVADLADPGQTFEALDGADAVVHLAAIPAPGLRPPADTFRINMLSTYNVFAAAEAHRLSRVVYASSETVLGLPFDDPPAFAPIDESHPPRPELSYALAKLAGETLAAQFARRTGVPHVGLRIEHHGAAGLRGLPGLLAGRLAAALEPLGHVDARDVALACELGLTADVRGAEVCIIAAADTVMTRDSRDLMAEVFPRVPLAESLGGRQTLLSIDRARETLGYEPRHAWRDELNGPRGT